MFAAAALLTRILNLGRGEVPAAAAAPVAGTLREGGSQEALAAAARKALAAAHTFPLTAPCYLDLCTLPDKLAHLAAEGLDLPAPSQEQLKAQLKDWSALTSWRIAQSFKRRQPELIW